MQYFRVFVFVLFPMLLFSQDFNKQWIGHYSYFNIKDLYATDDKIYAAAENSIFIYDIASGDSQTFSTVEGLSGEDITAIYHSSVFGLTLIGYQNGTIELLQDESTRTFIDIVEKPTIPPTQKRINHFYENGNILYISTGFGIIEFNLERIEFGDTFFIGPGGTQINITSTTIIDNILYASSTSNGVLSANITNPNLVDFNQWSSVVTGNFDGIRTFNNTLLVWKGTVVSSLIGGTLATVITIPSGIRDLKISSEAIVISLLDQVLVYNTDYQQTTAIVSNEENTFRLNTAIIKNENIYLGTERDGLLEILIENSSVTKQISPNGPLRNDSFGLEALNGNLWMVYGGFDIAFFPSYQTRGLSKLTADDEWINILPEDLLGATSLSHISINPFNEEQIFVSSYENGLLEINNNVPTALYNTQNSDLESLVPGGEVIRLNGSVFDSNGDLWINSSRVDNALLKLNPETKEILKVNMSSVLPAFSVGYTDTVIDENQNVYIAGGSIGVIGYNQETGTLVNIKDERSGLPVNFVSAMAIDRDNQLWIGTFIGLRVLFNPSEIFRGGSTEADQIIILDDEQVPQELLFGQTITDIEVDGSNNKWVATSSSGVFYFSPDGKETLAQFTEDNSPLPSNNVLDITVDDSTGAVFFATEKGLLEFKGTATGPEETLVNVQAFPNPVRPEFTGRVTIRGLTAQANVKITDIEGNLVYEEISEGGSIQWDTTAFGRHKVATGVYLILVTGEDQVETTVSKLLIVR